MQDALSLSTVALNGTRAKVKVSNRGAIMVRWAGVGRLSALMALCSLALGASALAQVTTSYVYDPQGQVRQVSSSIQNTSYAYDAAGNRASVANLAPTAGLAVNAKAKVDAAASSGSLEASAQSFAFPPPPRQRAVALPPPPADPPPVPQAPANPPVNAIEAPR